MRPANVRERQQIEGAVKRARKMLMRQFWFAGVGLGDLDDYEQRVRSLEAEGMTRSDAQAVADAELMP